MIVRVDHYISHLCSQFTGTNKSEILGSPTNDLENKMCFGIKTVIIVMIGVTIEIMY